MEILTSCQATFTDMASVEVGGRNLVLNSDIEVSFKNTYKTYELSEYGRKAVSGKTVTISLDACSDIDGITIDVYLRKIVDDVGSSCNEVASIKNIGTTYKRYSITISVQESDYIMQAAVRSNVRSGDGYNADAKVSIKNIKVEIGDVVTVYSDELEGGNSFTAAAEKIGTINYELLCAVGTRVPRIYIENGVQTELDRYL